MLTIIIFHLSRNAVLTSKERNYLFYNFVTDVGNHPPLAEEFTGTDPHESLFSNTALTPFTFLCRRSARLRLSITSCDILRTFVSAGLAVSPSLMDWSQLRAYQSFQQEEEEEARGVSDLTQQRAESGRGFCRGGGRRVRMKSEQDMMDFLVAGLMINIKRPFIKAWLKAAMLHLRSVSLSAGEINILQGRKAHFITFYVHI